MKTKKYPSPWRNHGEGKGDEQEEGKAFGFGCRHLDHNTSASFLSKDDPCGEHVAATLAAHLGALDFPPDDAHAIELANAVANFCDDMERLATNTDALAVIESARPGDGKEAR